ncbi:MAG TPA: hypothetical protein VK436_16505, partial [Methanocella sp.]|nr:hypothetical protein [Methanocella sp.]
LEQALDKKRTPGDMSRHIIIVTDTEVTDEGRILRLVSEEARRKDRRRISILCIDAAPNSFLSSQIAETGGGVSKFLTSDPEEGDISTALDGILEAWEQPVLANCKLIVEGASVETVGHTVKNNGSWGEVDLGDLPAKRAIWVSGKATGDRPPEIRLENHESKVLASCISETLECQAIKALTGARKILGLEFLIHSRLSGDDLRAELKSIGYDPMEIFNGRQSKLYPENNQTKETETIRNLIVSESLKYGIASSETAFVAISEKAGKKVEETAIVANALADGWSDGFLSRYGTPAPCQSPPGSGYMTPKPVRSIRAAPYELEEPEISADPSRCSSPTKKSLGNVKDMIDDTIDRFAGKAKAGRISIKQEAPKADEESPLSQGRIALLFDGVPTFSNGEAVIYDSSRNGRALSGISQLKLLYVELGQIFPICADGSLDARNVGDSRILVYIDDMSTPRASVRLSDLLRQRGTRPLNIAVTPATVLRIVLLDSTGSMKIAAPSIKMSIGVQ